MGLPSVSKVSARLGAVVRDGPSGRRITLLLASFFDFDRLFVRFEPGWRIGSHAIDDGKDLCASLLAVAAAVKPISFRARAPSFPSYPTSADWKICRLPLATEESADDNYTDDRLHRRGHELESRSEKLHAFFAVLGF